MPAIKKKNNTEYEVESHNKGSFYTINIDSKTCTCPHYQFRLKRFGGECKHLVAVRDFIAANSEVKEYKSKYKSKKTEKGSKAGKKENANKKENKAESKKNSLVSNDLTLKILKEVESNGEKDAIELIDKYGEIMVNDLIAKGYLLEWKGKVKVLK